MSTGIYREMGLRRFDQPFQYARPYVRALHFGSPYFFEIVVPTVIIAGGSKGLPKLLPLVKQVVLEPGRIRPELKENKVAVLVAEEETGRREARLDDPERLRQRAAQKQVRRNQET